MTDSWIIRAIEEEALRRAEEAIRRTMSPMVFGMTLPQIAWLRSYYMARGGVPEDINIDMPYKP